MSTVRQIAHRARSFLLAPLLQRDSSVWQLSDTASQLQLKLTYKAMVESGKRPPPLSETGFKVYSQTDEDGILLFIFALIGSETKKSVEICAGNGIECNTANLIIHHGWSGLLVDGNEALVRQGREFYAKNRHTYVYPPLFARSWITRTTVNQLLRECDFAGKIDLLSIDMDGVDYWIWDAIDAVDPNVVVVEYQDIIGPERSLTVPYKDDFNAYAYPTTKGMPNFCGASLPAFVKLAKRKGYRLVGCNRYGYNAFFVRNPLGEEQIPEVPVESCFRHPKVLWGMKERFPLVRDFPWVEV